MDTISDNARKLLDALPPDGSSIGGMKARDRIAMTAADFRVAKVELKNAGLVTLGRGRGGSIKRNVEAPVPEPPKKRSMEEQAAIAREGKKEKEFETKLMQANRERREAIKAWIAQDHGVDPEKIEVDFTGSEGSPLVFIPVPEKGPGLWAHRIRDEVLMSKGLI